MFKELRISNDLIISPRFTDEPLDGKEERAFQLVVELLGRSYKKSCQYLYSLSPREKLMVSQAELIEKVGKDAFEEAWSKYESNLCSELRDFHNQYDTFCKYRFLFFIESHTFEVVSRIFAISEIYDWEKTEIVEEIGFEKEFNRFLEYTKFGFFCDYNECLDEFFVMHVKTFKNGVPELDENNVFEIRLNPTYPFEVFERNLEELKKDARERYDAYQRELPLENKDIDDFFRDSKGRKRQGKQLPFERWENCLKVYRMYNAQQESAKNKAEISRQMGWFDPTCRPKCTEEITNILREAERLIQAAGDGTFPG